MISAQPKIVETNNESSRIINQEILKFEPTRIIHFVKEIMDNKIVTTKKFYPKSKEWFKFNMMKIIELNKSFNIFKTLEDYKLIGYIIINKILVNESFPLIYKYDKYNSNLQNKTKINTDVLYIFPDDVDKIKKFESQKILNQIRILDRIFLTPDFLLSRCVLFRGFSSSNRNVTKKTSTNIFQNLQGSYEVNKNFFKENQSVLFKNYSSFSFDPKISLNFIGSNGGYLLILNIKREHNIPGFFLSNIFFSDTITNKDINNYAKNRGEEMEVLICRNLRIVIKRIVKADSQSQTSGRSINNIYNDQKKNISKKKISIIYAETLPFVFPSEFLPQTNQRNKFSSFQYMCV
jgi:hypothetical protein